MDLHKILVCGSRHADACNRLYIRTVLSGYVAHGAPLIIHGDAPGVDTMAAEEAAALGFSVKPYPADWKRFGKAAGPRRNREMLDQNPDFVLAFWDGQSPGTRDTMDEAKKRGLEVVDAGLVC